MNCLVIFACLLSTSAASYVEISNDIKQYYKCTRSVRNMRIVWDDHRESVEDALKYAMQETIGKTGLNVFTGKEMSLRLTRSYYEKQGPVEIIFKNLHLMALPYCWLPDAVLSLSSNVLKIESTLTKMILNADYLLMRNKSDIIEDVINEDAFKNSPFLFKQVLNMGHVTLLVDGCMLSGYVIARLKRGRVNLGHENFMLTKCEYSVEIYKKGLGQPPVITRFFADNSEYSLGINNYLLMTLKDEFITKLQAAIFSYVNTSAIFGDNLPAYEEEQENLFLQTSSNLTKLIRDQNKIILNKTGGAVNIDDYFTTWDYWDPSISNELGEPATIRLSNMVLTGLDTAYNSFTGGPYKLDDPMIGEQIRFSKLQVRGEVSFTRDTDIYDFSVEISDFAVNIEINVKLGGFEIVKIKVVGYRDIQFSQPDLVLGPVQTLITGYLKKKVPEAVIETIACAAKTSPAQLVPGAKKLYFVFHYGTKDRGTHFTMEKKKIFKPVSAGENSGQLRKLIPSIN